eukprot:NODE_1955_length_525_cov_484.859244_g1592_i0.p2 GENE.NODE_1955_length_525_cov_484.859244_g1592_i0~~NODE_1955_length_525_cov_484.859244_g1592_i0.p2  ORF type:complete len:114 (+),score=12.81 NODE_1955_length_525_cov_484.859244_g1592_i0:32-373(+)
MGNTKDMRHTGRKVIRCMLLDLKHSERQQHQAEVVVPQYKAHNEDDKTLINLVPLLEFMAGPRILDIPRQLGQFKDQYRELIEQSDGDLGLAFLRAKAMEEVAKDKPKWWFSR